MKITSWNVNGLRAVIKKDFAQSLAALQTDILCLQETKAQDDQVVAALEGIDGYRVYSNSAVRKGYSGVAILTRVAPLAVSADIGIDEHDQEGRVTRWVAIGSDTSARRHAEDALMAARNGAMWTKPRAASAKG